MKKIISFLLFILLFSQANNLYAEVKHAIIKRTWQGTILMNGLGWNWVWGTRPYYKRDVAEFRTVHNISFALTSVFVDRKSSKQDTGDKLDIGYLLYNPLLRKGESGFSKKLPTV